MTIESSSTPIEGSLIGHYCIVSKIGVGGMGEVFLAEDTHLRRKVALKVLPDEIAQDADRLTRFKREALAISALNHPNILTIFEFGSVNGTHFLASEFVQGENLRERQTRDKLTLTESIEITAQIASALQAAHQEGIIHRDIKPENVMLREDGYVKVLDFGLAKHLDGNQLSEEDDTRMQMQTQAGMIMGTVAYMSPEQARGQTLDASADVWSLGCVLYELITRQQPFKGDTVSDTIANIIYKEPSPVVIHQKEIPPELERIIVRSLSKNKSERYQTAKDVFNDLKELQMRILVTAEIERSAPPNREEHRTQILESQITSETETGKSIAVLPFTNISPDKEDEYFSDGLTEEIISDLSKVRSLKVISRNSVMCLKGTTKDTRTIAQQLNVRYVLDGSVRKAGQNLRITAELIDGTTDAHLWSEKYNGTLDDIFEMQENVSRAIVSALKVTLSADEERRMEERPIDNPQVHDLYLRARHELQRGLPDALNRSMELLKQGLDIIGENELLYAALGYSNYFFFRWISKVDENYLHCARELNQKVISLNPESSHGYGLRGLLSAAEGNIESAIQSLQKSVAINPTNTEALLWLGIYCMFVGKHDEAMKHIDTVISLDPLLPLNIFIKGFAFIYHGEFEEGLPWIQRGLSMDNQSPVSIWCGAIGYAWCGKQAEAIEQIDALANMVPGWVYTNHALFLKHALLGEKNKALKFDNEDLLRESQFDQHFALHVAHCFALVGENDKALDFLELSVKTGLINHPFLSQFDPLLENLRKEERFTKLMQEAKRLMEELSV